MKSTCSLQIAILAVVLATNAVDAEVLQLAELNTRQIAALDRDKTIVIIPGGILEEHGPYLPSLSDGYVNIDESRQLAGELSERDWTVVMFPLIPLGAGSANGIGYRESYPGTYAIRAETLRAIFMDIAMELGEQGFRYVFIIHMHGAPQHNVALDQASQFFRDEYRAQMHNLSGYTASAFSAPELLSQEALDEEGFSVHAGVMETSIVMHVRPDLVAHDVTEAEPITGQNFADLIRIAREPNWTGYFGSPRWANAAVGKAISEKRHKLYLELALHVLDGGDPSEISGLSNFASQDEDDLPVDDQLPEEHMSRAERQQAWINRTGAEL